MAYKIYLDANFEPTTREQATLIKAVSDDGRVRFYHAHASDADTALQNNAMKAANTDRDAWLSIGAQLGVDFETIARAAWIDGCEHEMEHAATVNGDKLTIAKIALDHLREDANYYTKLRKVEGDAPTMKAVYQNAWGNVPPLSESELDEYARVTAADISHIEAELNADFIPFLNAENADGLP